MLLPAGYFQGAAVRPTPVAENAAELRALAPSTLLVEAMIALVAGVGSFVWTPSSTSEDDGTTCIKPADIGEGDPGRWLVASFGGGSDPLVFYVNPQASARVGNIFPTFEEMYAVRSLDPRPCRIIVLPPAPPVSLKAEQVGRPFGPTLPEISAGTYVVNGSIEALVPSCGFAIGGGCTLVDVFALVDVMIRDVMIMPSSAPPPSEPARAAGAPLRTGTIIPMRGDMGGVDDWRFLVLRGSSVVANIALPDGFDNVVNIVLQDNSQYRGVVQLADTFGSEVDVYISGGSKVQPGSAVTCTNASSYFEVYVSDGSSPYSFDYSAFAGTYFENLPGGGLKTLDYYFAPDSGINVGRIFSDWSSLYEAIDQTSSNGVRVFVMPCAVPPVIPPNPSTDGTWLFYARTEFVGIVGETQNGYACQLILGDGCKLSNVIAYRHLYVDYDPASPSAVASLNTLGGSGGNMSMEFEDCEVVVPVTMNAVGFPPGSFAFFKLRGTTFGSKRSEQWHLPSGEYSVVFMLDEVSSIADNLYVTDDLLNTRVDAVLFDSASYYGPQDVQEYGGAFSNPNGDLLVLWPGYASSVWQPANLFTDIEALLHRASQIKGPVRVALLNTSGDSPLAITNFWDMTNVELFAPIVGTNASGFVSFGEAGGFVNLTSAKGIVFVSSSSTPALTTNDVSVPVILEARQCEFEATGTSPMFPQDRSLLLGLTESSRLRKQGGDSPVIIAPASPLFARIGCVSVSAIEDGAIDGHEGVGGHVSIQCDGTGLVGSPTGMVPGQYTVAGVNSKRVDYDDTLVAPPLNAKNVQAAIDALKGGAGAITVKRRYVVFAGVVATSEPVDTCQTIGSVWFDPSTFPSEVGKTRHVVMHAILQVAGLGQAELRVFDVAGISNSGTPIALDPVVYTASSDETHVTLDCTATTPSLQTVTEDGPLDLQMFVSATPGNTAVCKAAWLEIFWT